MKSKTLSILSATIATMLIALPALGFSNLMLPGSGVSGGGAGVGTLQQVTTLGATTNIDTTFTGKLTFGNASGSLLTTTGQIFGPSGAAASPTYSFTDSANTGMYFSGTNLSLVNRGFLGVVVGDENVQIHHDLVPFVHNSVDIGETEPTVTNWRNIYASGTSYLGGVDITGFGATNTLPFSGFKTSFLSKASYDASLLGEQYSMNVVNSSGTGGWLSLIGPGTCGYSQFNSASSQAPFLSYIPGDMDQSSSDCVNFGITGVPSGVAVLSQTIDPIFQNESFYSFSNGFHNLGSPGWAWKNVYSSGTSFLTAVSSTSPLIGFSGLGAPGATSDLVCWTAVTGLLTHQTTNCIVSSAYFKEHIKNLPASKLMEIARKLQPVEYDLKSDGKHEKGFIAEEVALIDPSLVVFESTEDKDRIAYAKALYPSLVIEKDGKIILPKSVDYARVSVILTGAIQNMDDRLGALEVKLNPSLIMSIK